MQSLEIFLRLLEQNALGDLDLQAFGRQLRAGERGARRLDHIGFLELHGRNIDSDLDVVRHSLCVAACLAQNPFADRHDQSGLFRQWYKLAGRNQPLRRVPPAYERLDAVDAARPRENDRLIKKHELLPPNRLAKVVFKGVSRVGFGFELDVEHVEAIAPRALGFVKREIGVSQQFVAGLAVFRRQRGAYAASEDNVLSLDLIRRLDGVDQTNRKRLHAAPHRAFVGKDNQRELVAAETRHHVDFANCALDAIGNLPQQGVAGLMPERVVDWLEFVEVDREYRKFRRRPPLPRKRLLEPLSKKVSVGDVRQGVKMRQAFDLGLRAPTVSDVVMSRYPPAVLHWPGRYGDRASTRQGRRGREDPAARQLVFEIGNILVSVAREIAQRSLMLENRPRGATRYNQIRRQSIDLNVPIIADDKPLFSIEHADALRHVGERRFELD